MSTATMVEPAVAAKRQRPRQAKMPGGMDLGKDQSREAKRVAAAILEVLAGARSPTEAATALGLSVPRYYQVENRALRGLLAACEPQPKGRGRNPHKEVTVLRRDKERLQREVLRQQALVRAAQRAVGLSPPAAPAAKTAGKKNRQRRVARALTVATRLQQQAPDPVVATAVLATPPTSGQDKLPKSAETSEVKTG